MIYFFSALAGAFFMSALLIVAVCWADGQIETHGLLLEAVAIIGGFIFLSLAMRVGG